MSARVAFVRVLERGTASSPTLLRVVVDVEPSGDAGVEHAVPVEALCAGYVHVRSLVGVVEAGAGRDDFGNEWRGVPRSRSSSGFSFFLATVDHGRSEVPGPPPREGACGFSFIVSAIVDPNRKDIR